MTPARVCLVTTEILGLTRTGGIGTVNAALADLLVGMGHEVTVLCLNGRRAMDGPFDRWVAHYRARGVALVPLPPPDGPGLDGLWAEPSMARRWQVLHWLAAQRFDLVHFTDWGGEAALCGRARAQGVALRRTRLVLGLHGGAAWAMAGNDALPDSLARLVQIELEWAAPALMDAVWSPSAFMPRWLADQGAAAPQARLMPQPMPDPGPPRPPDAETAPVRDLVLFGRLEDRKGVAVLLDALDRMAARAARDPDAPRPARVTCLGRAARVLGEPARRVIARRAARWPWPVSVLDTLDRAAALEYLRGPGRMALILAPAENCPLTLHECLALRVPVLASATGGIPDLIAPEDHGRVLVPYEAAALADRLGAVLGRPMAPARAARDPAATAAVWRTWHEALLAAPAERAEPAVPPSPIAPLIAPDDRPASVWKATLTSAPAGAVCLLTDADRLAPEALTLLGDVLARTGADLLAPACAAADRTRPCLDSVPASAQAAPLVAGPGLVLGPRARGVAARAWNPDTGLWGLVAVCMAADLRHEAVPAVLLRRDSPWREPPAARARASTLWAAVLPAQRVALTAALLAGLHGEQDTPGPRAADPVRRAARRDRRRARALWRSWPWRITRPLRAPRRRWAGLPPEPAEPPPLMAPGAASDVLWGALLSHSWALAGWTRRPARRVRRLLARLRRPRR
ncbi:glycosyltransferase [Roseospira navarrensis]|uniref:glycosyltransferase n=1 Tax=Roseospira navarrensis TaxID=140058 RepID=UPI0014796E84